MPPLDIIPDGAPPEEPLSTANLGYAGLVPSFTQEAGAVLGGEPLQRLGRAVERGTQAGAGWFDQYLAQMGMTEAGLAIPEPAETPMLKPEEYNAKYAPKGESLGSEPMPEGLAQVLGEQKRQQLDREGILQRYQNAHSWPVNFATQAIVSMADPINAATAFLPGIGEETLLARLGVGAVARTAARIGAGAATGAVVQAPLSALRYGLSRDEFDDYSLRDAFSDIAAGAAGLAVIHAGIAGPISEFLRWRRGTGPLPAGVDPALAREATPVIEADAQITNDAMRSTVAQILDGRPVDATPFFPSPPEPTETAVGRFMGHPFLAPELRTPEPFLTNAESPIRPGMTRLYRGETALPAMQTVPDWIKESPEYQSTVEATGRWFSQSREDAQHYVDTHGAPGNKVTFVDIPTEDLPKYLSENQPEARRFSAAGRENEEYFVPRGVAELRVEVPPQRALQFEPPTLTTPAQFAEKMRALYRDGFFPSAPEAEVARGTVETAAAAQQPPTAVDRTPTGEPKIETNIAAFTQPEQAAGTQRTIIDVNGARRIVEEPIAAAEPPIQIRAVPREAVVERIPKQPERLNTWLIKNGGVKDPGGDVSQIVQKGRERPGLLNNRTGMNLDDAAQKAWEDGYFPGQERPSINDLLNAIEDDHRGRARYSEIDREAANTYRGIIARNGEVERLAQDLDIDPRTMTRAQFFDAIAQRQSADERAREIAGQTAAHETALRDAEERLKEWFATRGEAWEPDKYYRGVPRTLADLEKEAEDEGDKRWAEWAALRDREGEGGAGRPGVAGRDQGAISEGVGPRRGGAGVEAGGAAEGRGAAVAPYNRPAAILAELDERNAPDTAYRDAFSTGSRFPLKRGETWRQRLVDWAKREGRATTEQTAQGEQFVIPGAERSAQQAMEGREAAGRGRIPPPTAQAEPGGMFAPREPEQPGLFEPKADPELDAAERRFAETASPDMTEEERKTMVDTAEAMQRAEDQEAALREAADCLKEAGL